jgi:hypothetical protein
MFAVQLGPVMNVYWRAREALAEVADTAVRSVGLEPSSPEISERIMEERTGFYRAEIARLRLLEILSDRSGLPD